MENLEIAKKRQFLLDLIWAHSKTPDEVEEAFHDYTNSLRLEENSERNKLREQNAALRAAVKEMERMLPVLEAVEIQHPGALSEYTPDGTLANVSAYRQTLETALAKIEGSK